MVGANGGSDVRHGALHICAADIGRPRARCRVFNVIVAIVISKLAIGGRPNALRPTSALPLHPPDGGQKRAAVAPIGWEARKAPNSLHGHVAGVPSPNRLCGRVDAKLWGGAASRQRAARRRAEWGRG